MYKIVLAGFGIGILFTAAASAQVLYRPYPAFPPPPAYEGRSIYAPPALPVAAPDLGHGCFITTDPVRGIRHWYPWC